MLKKRNQLLLTLFTISALSLVNISSALDQPTSEASVGSALKKIAAALKSKGVSKIPSTSSIISSTSSSSGTPDIESVSGTPPQLLDIQGTDVKSLFWSSGVVQSIANQTSGPTQCRQFFSSDTDADSGGLGACQMTEGVGHAFEDLLRAESSLCFLKNLPTQANLDAGGIVLVSGKFPSSNVTRLFAPTAKQRVVQIETAPINSNGPSENIFVVIPSKSKNEAKNMFYQATLYFCPTGQAHPRGVNTVKVTEKGVLKLALSNASDPFNSNAANALTVQGFVTFSDGSIVWDATRTRRSTLNVVGGTKNFKSSFQITSDNLIYQKVFNLFGQRSSKTYSIAEFSGTTIDDLSFLQGAFINEDKFNAQSNVYSGATEYRDTYYAAAPDNTLLDNFSSYTINTDPYFLTPPEADPDNNSISCSRTPDVRIRMVEGNSTLESSLSGCIQDKFTNSEFCRNDATVQLAVQRFPNSCPPPP